MALFFDDAVRRPLLAYVPRWIKPNHLSLLRIALVAPFIAWRHAPTVALSLLVVSGLLDLLDGPLARVRGEESQLGAFLDSLADKVFVFSALIFACAAVFPLWMIVALAAVECGLVLVRPIKRLLGLRIDANNWSKIKLWLEMISIGCALTGNGWLVTPARGLLGLAVWYALLALGSHVRDLFRRPVRRGES